MKTVSSGKYICSSTSAIVLMLLFAQFSSPCYSFSEFSLGLCFWASWSSLSSQVGSLAGSLVRLTESFVVDGSSSAYAYSAWYVCISINTL